MFNPCLRPGLNSSRRASLRLQAERHTFNPSGVLHCLTSCASPYPHCTTKPFATVTQAEGFGIFLTLQHWYIVTRSALVLQSFSCRTAHGLSVSSLIFFPALAIIFTQLHPIFNFLRFLNLQPCLSKCSQPSTIASKLLLPGKPERTLRHSYQHTLAVPKLQPEHGLLITVSV